MLGAGVIALVPFAARAKQPIIGILGGSGKASFTARLSAFHEGLSAAGFTPGVDVAIEERWSEGQYEELPELARELLKQDVAMIAAFTTPAARAAQAATSTVPIVFTTISDPVQTGFVASLSRPGGNMTGVSMQSVEAGPKLVELLRDIVPKAKAFGLLINPANPSADFVAKNISAAAEGLVLKLHILKASKEADIEPAFTAVRDLHLDGLMIPRDAFIETLAPKLGALVVRDAVPAICQDRRFSAAGGLMSFTAAEAPMYRQVGLYAARILKGERPADLPIVEPTKFDLSINLKAAKALGLQVPQGLLVSADEVVE